MIIKLSEETCCNPQCKQKLANGRNIGGWKAHRTKEANYESGYLCKKCSRGSTTGTQKLYAWQQHHYYPTPEKEPDWKIPQKHKKQWNKLIATLQQEEYSKETTNDTKTPTWNQVLDRMEQKQIKEAKA